VITAKEIRAIIKKVTQTNSLEKAFFFYFLFEHFTKNSHSYEEAIKQVAKTTQNYPTQIHTVLCLLSEYYLKLEEEDFRKTGVSKKNNIIDYTILRQHRGGG